jgi:DNA polymerase III delta prime subunit
LDTTLWVDRYIPQTLDEYVWRDGNLRAKAGEWIAAGALPHLCFAGKSGLGKTSLAKLLLKLLNVPSGDILFIKASRVRKVELLEAQITGFVQTYPMIENEHGIKYVILDEADALSLLSQKFLRSEIEQYSATVRFIFTCNYVEKIESAIRSRCQEFNFEALDQSEFVMRVAEILDREGVAADTDILCEYIEAAYPDLRKCIGLVEQNTVEGRLCAKPKSDHAAHDFMFEVVEMFRKRQHTAARKLIISQASPEEYDDIYRWLYRNVELFGDTPDQHDDALIIVRDGLYKSKFVADEEINLSATICEMVRLTRK